MLQPKIFRATGLFFTMFILGVSLVLPVFQRFEPVVADEINNTGEVTVCSGLVFEDMTVEWLETGNSGWGGSEVSAVRLTNNYTDITLSSWDLFVPDVFPVDGSNTLVQYRFEEYWGGDAARLQYNLQYSTSYDYGSSDLNTLLGNDLPVGDEAVVFVPYDGSNYQTYTVGTVVSYQGSCYQALVSVSNVYAPPSPGLWMSVSCPEPGTGSVFPQNFFQTGSREVYSYNLTDQGHVFHIDNLVDVESSFNVSWYIKVSSHYHRVIVDYELWFVNSSGQVLVETFQDIYTGVEPVLLPVDVECTRFYNSSSGFYDEKISLSYDNNYGNSRDVNLTVAYPLGKDSDFLGVVVSSGVLSEYGFDLYSDVVAAAEGVGDTSTLLGSTDGYMLRSYFVNITGDDMNHISFKLNSSKSESNDFRIWLTGSFGGGGGNNSILVEPYVYTDFVAPSNSFGVGNTIFTDINRTFFRSWLNDTVVWDVQKSTDNISWVGFDDFIVSKIWDMVNLSYKYTINVSSDEDAYYRILLNTEGSDIINLTDYSNLSVNASDEMELVYSVTDSENYTCFFNWSDYTGSSVFNETTYEHEVVTSDSDSYEDVFEFVVVTNDFVEMDGFFELDPTFGYSYSGTSGTEGIYRKFIGCTASPASNGTLDNITGQFYWSGTKNVIGLVYNSSGYLTAQSEIVGDGGGYPCLVTFDFEETYHVYSNETYVMGFLCEYSNVYVIYKTGVSGQTRYYKNMLVSSIETTVSWDDSSADSVINVYASYTEEAVMEWNDTGFSFGGGNVTSWESTGFSFGGGNSSSWSSVGLSFSGGNATVLSWQDTGFSFSGGNSSSWSSTGLSFTGGNSIEWSSSGLSFSGGNNSSWSSTGLSFHGGNSSSWSSTGFSFTGGNATVLSWQSTGFSFGGGNSSDWSSIGLSFSAGNISEWSSTGFSFTGGNSTSWSSTGFSFSGGNGRSWSWQNTGFSFSGGNGTSWSSTGLSFQGGNVSDWSSIGLSFSGGNSSSWSSTGFSFSGGNSSEWSSIGFSFHGGNTTTWSWQSTGFSFTGDNTSKQWLNTGFSFTAGNSTGWNSIGFSFTGGNGSITMSISNPYPANNSYLFDTQPTLAFTLSHPNGDLMNYSIFIGNSSVNLSVLLTNDSLVDNGTYFFDNYYMATDLGEVYYWMVCVDDGEYWLNETFHFQYIEGVGSIVSTPGFEGPCFVLGCLLISVFLYFRKKKDKKWSEV